MGFFDKIKQGLTKTKKNLDAQLTGIFASYTPGDEEFFEDLEESLILADTGVETTERAIHELRRAIELKKLRTGTEVKQEFVRILTKILKVQDTMLLLTTQPSVVLVVGVNGVGKTTTCENLGVGLAQAGKKVLLIDGDPQGSLTISLGHPQPDKLPFTLSDAMGRILMDEPLRPGEGILHHPEGVDLMPADIQLSGMEVSLVNAMSRETILRQYLDTLKGQYSHILIDCQPSLGMLTVNALAAANRVINRNY